MRKISNQLGDKDANPQISKKAFSANIRTKRKLSVVMPNFNKKFCGECGFRVRGTGHLEGSHHTLGTVK